MIEDPMSMSMETTKFELLIYLLTFSFLVIAIMLYFQTR
jgi:hypothetical protein